MHNYGKPTCKGQLYSGVARGNNGGGPPRTALLGGGKIEVIPKKIEDAKSVLG